MGFVVLAALLEVLTGSFKSSHGVASKPPLGLLALDAGWTGSLTSGEIPSLNSGHHTLCV